MKKCWTRLLLHDELGFGAPSRELGVGTCRRDFLLCETTAIRQLRNCGAVAATDMLAQLKSHNNFPIFNDAPAPSVTTRNNDHSIYQAKVGRGCPIIARRWLTILQTTCPHRRCANGHL